jgi:Family of unknown function (DUF5317)
MALACLALVLAVAVGRVAGGRVARLAGLPLAGWPLVIVAAAAQAGGAALAVAVGAPGPYAAGSLVATVAVVCFLARNRALHGVPLVAAGLACNAAVVTANGGMPVSAAAARVAGVAFGPIAAGLDPRHVVAGAGTTLGFLADRFPLPFPVRPEVVSAGDVLVAAGVALLVVTGMTTGARYDDGLRPQRRQAESAGAAPSGIRATTRDNASTTRGSYS